MPTILRAYDNTGTLLWTHQFGTTDNDGVQSVTIDRSGNLYIAGATSGTFDGQTKTGFSDAFLCMVDRAGNLVWTRQFGSGQGDNAYSVAVDNTGVIYVTGSTYGEYQDAFLRAYDSTGDLIWVRQFGATNASDVALGMALDSTGTIYVAVDTNGAFEGQTNSGGYDVVLCAFDRAGNLVWTHQFGSSTTDDPFGVAIDSSGSLYVVGRTFGTLPGQTDNISFSQDAFLVKVANPVNAPPTVNAGDHYAGKEGAPIALTAATAADPENDPLTYAWSSTAVSADSGATCTFSDVTFLHPTVTCTDNGTFNVTLTITDGHNPPVSANATVIVANVNLIVTVAGPPAGSIYPLNTVVPFTGVFSDAGTNDNHTNAGTTWTFDNGITPAISVPGGSGISESSRIVSSNYTFTTAGVYNITLYVSDDNGGIGTANTINGQPAYIVIYDPSAGFVTGGGWITSPAGAYPANPTLTGHANFGFVSKYQKGATRPTGQTAFHFQAGNLIFDSTGYDWLVVAGTRAQYKGTGTINGSGDYAFMLTAIDGQLPGGGDVDQFRLKIWDPATNTTIYDNQMGANDTTNPTTVIAGGSIIIHP